MSTNGYTIAVKKGDEIRKITKLLFSKDGSYMLVMPYHVSDKGVLFKMPVSYKPHFAETTVIPYQSMIDAGDVDGARVKLSHHRSGLVQFSGDGVVSGLDDDGRPRGIGVQSWALETPPAGPAFAIAFAGLHDFKLASSGDLKKLRDNGITFDLADLPEGSENGFAMEGFYFPPEARRFLKQTGNDVRIQIMHPIGIVIDLKVALPDLSKCEFGGFIGFALYREMISLNGGSSGYIMSSSTGNLRTENGTKVGDALYCVYPDNMGSFPRRNLNYQKSEGAS